MHYNSIKPMMTCKLKTTNKVNTLYKLSLKYKGSV